MEIIAYEFDDERSALVEALKWVAPLSDCPNMMYDFRAYDDKIKIESKVHQRYPELLI